jgi:hypothetical protein
MKWPMPWVDTSVINGRHGRGLCLIPNPDSIIPVNAFLSWSVHLFIFLSINQLAEVTPPVLLDWLEFTMRRSWSDRDYHYLSSRPSNIQPPARTRAKGSSGAMKIEPAAKQSATGRMCQWKPIVPLSDRYSLQELCSSYQPHTLPGVQLPQ